MRILQSQRLALRWFNHDDAPFILRLLNEPSWLQHIGDRQVRSLEQAQVWLQNRLVSGYWRQGMGFWAVCLLGQQNPIGLCGLIQRDSLPEVDVGYAFLPTFWGQGYAQEAAGACLHYGHEVLGLHRILAITGPDNQPSQNVLQRLGMQLEQRCILPGETRETLVHAWPARSGTSAVSAARDAAPNQDSQDDQGGQASQALQDIQALSQRFTRLLDNRDGTVARLPSLPALCLPEVRFVQAGATPMVLDLPGFMHHRATQLAEGHLLEFAQWEVQGQTQLFGHMAQHWQRTASRGLQGGQACASEGCQSLHLVRTPKGWRIGAVVWEGTAPL